MPTIEIPKIRAIFDYVRSETTPLARSNGAFVFGRTDPLVASRAAELYHQDLVEYCLMLGGIGKDSGYLTDLQIPESKFQGGLLNLVHKVPKEKIFLETTSRNGAECCDFGIDVINRNSLPRESLTIVVHPTSLLRTDAVMRIKAEAKGFKTELQRTGTRYSFNSQNPVDQREAVAELLRIADWPAKGWAAPQPDLPQGLVDYARSLDSAWKAER